MEKISTIQVDSDKSRQSEVTEQAITPESYPTQPLPTAPTPLPQQLPLFQHSHLFTLPANGNVAEELMTSLHQRVFDLGFRPRCVLHPASWFTYQLALTDAAVCILRPGRSPFSMTPFHNIYVADACHQTRDVTAVMKQHHRLPLNGYTVKHVGSRWLLPYPSSCIS